MHLQYVPIAGRSLHIVVLSPHRLVPLALGAAGRADRSFVISGAAVDAEEAEELVRSTQPDVFVFDPTALSLGRMARLIEQVAPFLFHPTSLALLLEPAQAATSISARFAWDAGVRCAMTSQDSPEYWPVAIASAARKATFASPMAMEIFGWPPIGAVEEDELGVSRARVIRTRRNQRRQ